MAQMANRTTLTTSVKTGAIVCTLILACTSSSTSSTPDSGALSPASPLHDRAHRLRDTGAGVLRLRERLQGAGDLGDVRRPGSPDERRARRPLQRAVSNGERGLLRGNGCRALLGR